MHIQVPPDAVYPSISKLPSELLSVIFEHYHRAQPLSPAAEITLSQISRLWRNIALYTPQIWSRLSVTFYTPPDKIETYLQRSAGCSLVLSLDFSHNAPRESPFVANHIFASVCESWKRWQVLRVRSTVSVWKELLDAMPPSLPLLRTLDIHITDIAKELAMRRIIFTPKGAPLLASVSLTGIGLPYCLPPLFRITRLSLSDIVSKHWISRRRFAKIVSGIQSLISLSIQGEIFFDEDSGTSFDESVQTIDLLSLHTLELTSIVEFGSLLMIICAPALDSLILRNIGSVTIHQLAFPTGSHASTSKQFFGSLRALSIETPRAYSMLTWSALEKLFPNITHLTVLLCKEAYPSFFESINQWPTLNTLTLNEHVLENPNICQMIPSLTRIDTIWIMPHDGFMADDEVIYCLNEFRKVLRVEIVQEDPMMTGD